MYNTDIGIASVTLRYFVDQASPIFLLLLFVCCSRLFQYVKV